MSEPISFSNDHEQVLMQFQQDQDQAKDPAAVLGRYIEQYPQLERRLRHLAAMPRLLQQLTVEPDPQMPAKLREFRVLRRLDRGGMGEIYLARHDRLERMVAIKVIRRGRISPDARRRFLREQQVLAHLHQTHIVPIFTAGEVDELQYFVMPYINGVALDKVLSAARASETPTSSGHLSSLRELASNLIPKESAPFEKPLAPALGQKRWAEGECGAVEPDDSIPTRCAPTSLPDAEPCRPTSSAQEKRECKLSLAYFRSVAETMADAAGALHRVHKAGVIHRDLKPANLMLEADGNSWVIDFGLAGFLNGQSSDGTRIRVTKTEPEALTTTGIMGTPPYMPPEQWDGQASVLTDIWSLGATLYELLTLHQAFCGASLEDVRAAIVTANSAPPSSHVRNIPADLSAICLKALRKEPSQRYRSAREFADDLRRWLGYEPTIARPARVPRRLFMWSRRNPGWAAALVTWLAAALAVAWFWILAVTTEKDRLVAEAKEEIANDKMLLSLVQERLHHRVKTTGGWSEEAWKHVREGVKLGGSELLRDQAVATLAGLDAHFVLNKSGFGASSVAFAPEGKRLLLGGDLKNPARVWDTATDSPLLSKIIGAGPVAFRADGTPLQAVAPEDEPGSVLIWNSAKNQGVGKFQMPGEGKLKVRTIAMTPDASFLAAATASPEGQEGAIAAWEMRTGTLLRTFDKAASEITLSPDGTLLAAGDKLGGISIWSLATGERLGVFSGDRAEIQSLAFGRDVRRSQGKRANAATGWLLASGSSAGGIVVWDLEAKQPRSFCRGPEHNVYAVAFSPDGVTLAGAGRYAVRLWDIATGRLLLTVGITDYQTGLAFSPDGRRLAVSHAAFPGYPGGFSLLELEPGRGIQTLRGLACNVIQVLYSPDGNYIAGLSHDWRVGIWQAKTGKLLHVLDVPVGLLADNAGFAFSHDNKQFAFCAGTEARLWDVASGEERKSWPLPPGLVDSMAFQPSGKLVLLRMETKDGKRRPDSDAPPEQFPRVCRLRELPMDGPAKEVTVKDEFNLHVFLTAVPPDGSYFVVTGVQGRQKPYQRAIRVWGASDGKELWSQVVQAGPSICLEPTGRLLQFSQDESGRQVIVEMPSGKLVGPPSPGGILSPGARYAVMNQPFPAGQDLIRLSDGKRLVAFGIESAKTSSYVFGFDPAGTHYAWGAADGTVIVADINEVQRRLASVGLGW
jgi:serine/threonine protein kinase/WD40 repeat protein